VLVLENKSIRKRTVVFTLPHRPSKPKLGVSWWMVLSERQCEDQTIYLLPRKTGKDGISEIPGALFSVYCPLP